MENIAREGASMTYDKDTIGGIDVLGVKYPRVSTILKPVSDSRWYTPGAAKRGSDIHMLTEYIDTGFFKSEYADDIFRPYLSAYEKFFSDSGAKVVASEMTVVYNGDASRYIGTLDRVLKVNGKVYVVDIKTGSLRKWHGFQLAAYEMAYRYTTGEKGKLYRAILEIRKDGEYRFHTAFRGVSFTDDFFMLEWKRMLREFWQEHGGEYEKDPA